MIVLGKINRILNRIFIMIAGIFLAGMLMLTWANIFLRMVWVPIKGTYELMGFFGAVITALALGYTQLEKGHTAVDILVNRFSAKIQKMLNAFNYIICMLFFAIAGWQIAKYATTLWETGEVTETLRFAYYPFAYGVALGCFLLSLVMLIECLMLVSVKKGAP
jgi:TRAP-type C4-dicarboxylate transport system permease small subunit